MKLAWATDIGYLEATVTSVHSALASTPSPESAQIAIITFGVPCADRKRLADWATYRWPQTQLRVVDFDRDLPFKVDRHLTRATYTRLYLAELLPAWSRAIYLDSDTLVRGDLCELWDTSLEGAPAAGAIDPGAKTLGSSRGLSVWEQHGLDSDWPYVNAGVLLIDLAIWRAEDIQSQLVTALAKDHCAFRYHDQDALNLVLAGRWKLLDPIWNVWPTSGDAAPRSALLRRFEQVALAGHCRHLRKARVIHFAGALKPWNASLAYPAGLRHRWARFRSGWRRRPNQCSLPPGLTASRS